MMDQRLGTPQAITDIPGILVGNWTDARGRTGCTVVLCPSGTIGSGEVFGAAPGSRETELLRPGMTVEEVNAVLITGGSAFGLAAADGVMRWLEERGIGMDAAGFTVPIVPAAALFDLNLGDPTARPDANAGYAACEAAGSRIDEGNVGAGTGATVAKIHGLGRARKGGLGSSSQREGELVVGALAAVNAVGEVIGEAGELLAGAVPDADEGLRLEGIDEGPPLGANTVLVVVATNAKLSRERAHLLTFAASEGVKQAVRPAHTAWDGDTVFSLATGEVNAEQSDVERLAASTTADAIRRGVRAASDVPGAPAAPAT